MKCPSINLLENLQQGTVEEPLLDDLLEHVSTCEQCQSRLHLDDPESELELNEAEIANALLLDQFAEEPNCQHLIANLKTRPYPLSTPTTSSSQPTRISSGTVIGDFRLIRLIGQGGMGIVYEAEQISLPRRVAIKVLSHTGVISDQQLQRFRNEALAAARLDHPHIVPIQAVGESDGNHYLIMKLIDGPNLATVINELASNEGTTQKSEELSWLTDFQAASKRKLVQNHQFIRFVVERFVEIAKALRYAHDRGVVHRDINPANLLIDKSGKFWVSDFGIAKFDRPDDLTLTGAIMGTPRYMSPEQAGGRKRLIDQRTDIYSWGATLYELLTLNPLFAADDLKQLYSQIADVEPTQPRTHNPAISVDLETILLKTLNKELVDRYDNADELLNDLDRYLNGKPILARRPNLYEVSTKWFQRHKIFTASLISVAIVSLMAMVIITTLMVFHGKRQQELLDVAEQSQLKLNETLYFSRMKEAGTALNSGDSQIALKILNDTVPQMNDPDFRGGEWFYLNNQVQNTRQLVTETNTPLYAVSFSHQGNYFATSGQDAIIRVYDSVSFELLQEIDTGQVEVNGLAFSPDDRFLASSGDDGTLRIWRIDWENQLSRQILLIQADERIAFSIQFSHDGNSLISTGTDKTIKIWDVVTGSLKGQLIGHLEQVKSIALSPVENQLASTGDDGALIVWDLNSYKSVYKLKFDRNDDLGRLTDVAYSPDGQYIAIAGINKKIQVRDTQTQSLVASFSHSDEVRGLVFSPDGKSIISRDFNGFISVWPLPGHSSQKKHFWKAHKGRVYLLALSPHDNKLFSVGEDGLLLSWNYQKPFAFQELQKEDNRFQDIHFIRRNGKESLLTLDRDELELWDPATGLNNGSLFKSGVPLSRTAVSEDLSFIVAGGPKGDFLLYDVKQSEVIKNWKTRDDFELEHITISPDNRYFAAISANRDSGNALYLYNLETSQPIPHNLPQACNAVSFSTNSQKLYFSGEGNTILIWDLSSQRTVNEVKGHNNGTHFIKTLPRFNLIATSGADRMIKLWSPESWASPLTLTGHKGDVNYLECSPLSPRMLSCSKDKQIKVWSLIRDNEQSLLTIDLKTFEPQKACFSQDGQYLAALLIEHIPVSKERYKRNIDVRIYKWLPEDFQPNTRP